MAVLTITLLIANIALVGAAITKFKETEQKITHDVDMINIKVEKIRMRHKQDIVELEECVLKEIEEVNKNTNKATENLFWRIITTPLKMDSEDK